MRLASITLAAWLPVGAIAGTPSFEVVPVETGAESVDHIFVFDQLVSLNDSDGWAASVVEVESVGGATLRYNIRQDANGVAAPLAGPGVGMPFNTFASTPRRPDADHRFDAANGGAFALEEPVLSPSRYSAGLFTLGPPVSFMGERAILRIAFEAPTTGGPLTFGDIYFVPAVNDGRGDPDSAQPIEPTHARLLTLRTDHSTPPWLPPSFNGAFFAFPEPASVALLVIGLLSLRRR